MKAAVFCGPRDVRTEEVERPKIDVNEILIKVRACGICGSDLHVYKLGMWPEIGVSVGPGRMIMGHEFSGDVVETGDQVEGIKVGDRVAQLLVMGGMAEYVKGYALLNENVFHIPSEVSYEEAATLEPLATSLHAVNVAGPREGDTILIMGAGIIGLGVLQVLKAWHSTRVIVADFSQTRLAMAKQLGADHTIDVSEGSTYEKLMQMVGPAKPSLFQREESCAVDIAMECAGRSIGAPGAPAAAEILNIVQNDAKVVLVGTYEEKIEMDLNLIVGKALKVMGAVAFDSEEVGEVLELIRARKVDRKTPITHEFSLDRAKEAYETQLSVNSSIKVLVKP